MLDSKAVLRTKNANGDRFDKNSCGKFNYCSGHGGCEVDFCNCDEGWFGIDCSMGLSDLMDKGKWKTS